MSTASAIRLQIEAALAHKFPSALTPPARMMRPVVSSGIGALDDLVQGGFPVGAVTELVGELCSGRMSVAMSFLSQVTAAEKVCAWIDASDTFNPSSAAAVGVDLRRLLWVRCGVSQTVWEHETRKFTLPSECFTPKPAMKGLHGGGHGTHPRNEAKGLSKAIDRFLSDESAKPRSAESISKSQWTPQTLAPSLQQVSAPSRSAKRARVYDVVEQAIKSTDLLIQTGGFGAIVLDLGEISSDVVSRIDLAAWHRYRVAAERTQASILLLSQYACAKSSSELQLRLSALEDTQEERTVFTGLNARVEVLRQRFAQTPSNVVPMRKPPQSAREARCWTHRASWVGPR